MFIFRVGPYIYMQKLLQLSTNAHILVQPAASKIALSLHLTPLSTQMAQNTPLHLSSSRTGQEHIKAIASVRGHEVEEHSANTIEQDQVMAILGGKVARSTSPGNVITNI